MFEHLFLLTPSQCQISALARVTSSFEFIFYDSVALSWLRYIVNSVTYNISRCSPYSMRHSKNFNFWRPAKSLNTVSAMAANTGVFSCYYLVMLPHTSGNHVFWGLFRDCVHEWQWLLSSPLGLYPSHTICVDDSKGRFIFRGNFLFSLE